MDFGGAFSSLSQIPIDWMIIGVFFIIVFVDAIRTGSIRAASLAVSFPLTAYLYQMLAQTALFSSVAAQFKTNLEQALIFAILEVVIFVCLHQMLRSFDTYTSIMSAAVCGLAATMAVLAAWTGVPVLQSIWHFDPLIQTIFGASYRFLWLLAAYLALAFIGS